jgi:hypothetical protein
VEINNKGQEWEVNSPDHAWMSWSYPGQFLPPSFHDGNALEEIMLWMETLRYPDDISIVLLVIGLALREFAASQFNEGDFDPTEGIPAYVWASSYTTEHVHKLEARADMLRIFLEEREEEHENDDEPAPAGGKKGKGVKRPHSGDAGGTSQKKPKLRNPKPGQVRSSKRLRK